MCPHTAGPEGPAARLPNRAQRSSEAFRWPSPVVGLFIDSAFSGCPLSRHSALPWAPRPSCAHLSRSFAPLRRFLTVAGLLGTGALPRPGPPRRLLLARPAFSLGISSAPLRFSFYFCEMLLSLPPDPQPGSSVSCWISPARCPVAPKRNPPPSRPDAASPRPVPRPGDASFPLSLASLPVFAFLCSSLPCQHSLSPLWGL